MIRLIKKSSLLFSISLSAIVLSGCATHKQDSPAIERYIGAAHDFDGAEISKEIEACVSDIKCKRSFSFKSDLEKMTQVVFARNDVDRFVDSGSLGLIGENYRIHSIVNKKDLLSYKGSNKEIAALKYNYMVKNKEFGALYDTLMGDIEKERDEKTVQIAAKNIRGIYYHLGCKDEFNYWGRINSDYDPRLFPGSPAKSLNSSMKEEDLTKNMTSIFYRDFKSLTISHGCALKSKVTKSI